MGIRLFQEPVLEDPVLIACWPGIGNAGLIAVDTLREAVRAEELGEIEAWDFFYPRKVVVKNGELREMTFPGNKFYFKKTPQKDVIFFVAEEQPADAGKAYAEGKKAYEMANLVLDVAVKFGCRRVYTSGAAVAAIYHTARSRVWAVPNDKRLVDEIRGYANTVLMSGAEGRGGHGSITGLNGLLLGVAKQRGLEAMCIMGEVPVYLQGIALAYPKASKSILEVLAAVLGVSVRTTGIDAHISRSEKEIEKLYESFPLETREEFDKLRQPADAGPTGPGPITEDDKRRILADLDNLFKKEEDE